MTSFGAHTPTYRLSGRFGTSATRFGHEKKSSEGNSYKRLRPCPDRSTCLRDIDGHQVNNRLLSISDFYVVFVDLQAD